MLGIYMKHYFMFEWSVIYIPIYFEAYNLVYELSSLIPISETHAITSKGMCFIYKSQNW